jgi:alkylhydroperoxidase/carboxymuconolactone decarboxylase family protein YurZ
MNQTNDPPSAPAPEPSVSSMPHTDDHIRRGDWNPLWDQLRALDPEFMEAYLALRSVPQRNGPLPPKMKELILVAVNAATTHLYAPGVRRHMRNALAYGATAEEIMETIELTTLLGIHSCNLAIPILVEELAKREGKASMPEASSTNLVRKSRLPGTEDAA